MKTKFANALAAARIKKLTREAGDTSAADLRKAQIEKYKAETKKLETAQTINDNYFKSKVDALKQNIVDIYHIVVLIAKNLKKRLTKNRIKLLQLVITCLMNLKI